MTFRLRSTLKELLDDLEEFGIEPIDYDVVEICLDYGSCYYEGDEPRIKVIIPDELIRK